MKHRDLAYTNAEGETEAVRLSAEVAAFVTLAASRGGTTEAGIVADVLGEFFAEREDDK